MSVQRFLGHSDIETTLKIYTHLSEQKEQAAIDALNAHLVQKQEAKIRSLKSDAVKMQ